MSIVTIGGATQDFFLQYDGADTMSITKKSGSFTYALFESGEKVELDTVTAKTGGGATNAAVSFKRQGFAVACISTIGNDQAGEHVLSDLEQAEVSSNLIMRLPNEKTGTSYILSSVHGERTLFAHRGANTMLGSIPLPLDKVTNARQFYITSLNKNAAAQLPAITEYAKKHHISVAINPGTKQLSSEALTLKQSLGNIDILIVNSSEARMFMQTLTQKDECYRWSFQVDSTETPRSLNATDASAYLLKYPMSCQDMMFSIHNFFIETLAMGPRIVVVTNGANGVYVGSNKTIWFHPSIPTKVINTVGAGDAFGSCFVGSLLQGHSIPDALRRGIINSASVLGTIGAKDGLLTTEQLTQRATELSEGLLKTFDLQR